MTVRKQRKREYKKRSGQDIICKDMTPVTQFLQLDPTSYLFNHLPIIPSYYEFMKGLIHSLGQSHHDLIISVNASTNTPRGVLY
jgi:hypothetical protein